MTKRLEFLKPVKPFVQGFLYGVAGLVIFVFVSSRFGMTVDWVVDNALLGTLIIGGSLLLIDIGGKKVGATV